MSVLKNLSISLLSFLLFLCLAVFGTIYALDKTLLDPDFVTAEINRLDMQALVGELFSIEGSMEASYINEAIDETIAELEPWAKEEIGTAIHSAYDYMLGRAQHLRISIPTQPVIDSLSENLREVILASPPAELETLPPSQQEQYIDEAIEQFIEDVPSTIELDESLIPADVMETLEQVRSYLTFYKTLYYGLIVLMVLFALGIFLISRDLRYTTRSIGTTVLVYGIIGFAITFLMDYFHLEEQIMNVSGGSMPAHLETWMMQFMDNMMAPVKTFEIALIIAGVILVIFSIVYKPRQSPPPDEPTYQPSTPEPLPPTQPSPPEPPTEENPPQSYQD